MKAPQSQLNPQVRLSTGSRSLPLVTRFALASLLWIFSLSASNAQTVGITGSPCVGQDIIFYLTGSCSGFTWSVTGGSITSGQGTGSVHVTYSSATTSNIQVSATCGGSFNTYQMNGVTIGAYVTPAVTLAVSPSPVCKGGLLAMSSTPTNGGTPTYNYFIDGSSVYSGSANPYNYNTTSLSPGAHTAYVIMTSSVTCVTSTTATSSTQNFTVTAKTTYSANISGPGLICQGTTSVTLGATAVGSVGGLTYEWFKMVGGVPVSQGAATSSNTHPFNSIANGDVMYCKIYSTDWCVDSPAQTANYTVSITSTVTPILSVQVSPNTICSGQTMTFTAQGSHLSGATFQWLLAGNVLAGQTGPSIQLTASSTSQNGLFGPTSVVTLNASGFTGNCLSTTSGTANTSGAPVTIKGLPNAIANAQTICSGSASNIGITTDNGVSGATYSWVVQSSSNVSGASGSTGSPIAQTLTSTNGTSNGSVTYRITPVASSCAGPTTDVTVTVQPLPANYTAGGTGSFCGSSSVTLSNSQSGFSYQLKRNGTDSGSALSGAGSGLTWINLTQSGSYTVVAKNASATCPVTMIGTATVTILTQPIVYAVSGSGTFCGSATISLSNSESGATYQLKRNGTNVGSAVTGSGTALTWTGQALTGSYTITSTLTSSGCVLAMSGTAAVTINPLPTLYNVTGSGTFCVSTSVSVSNSDAGTSYQLKRNGTAVGSTVSGTGSALNWTSLATSGSYTITSTIVSTGCAVDMSGTAAVTINPLPTLYTVGGAGTFCLTTSPSLGDTDTGINYQLKSGSTSIGSPIAGTGSAITMPAVTTTGTYTVIATNASTSCVQTMTGSAAVTIQTEIPNAVASAQTICSSSSTSIGITTNNGVTGATYAWVVQTSSNSTGASASSGTTISQALTSTNGTTNGSVTYRITPSKGSCIGSTTDAIATVQPMPVSTYTVGGAGTFCGSTPVTLSNSQTNFTYQLKRGGTNVGSAATGNAALLTWAGQAQTGSYTVEAKNPSGTCPVTMSGTAAVTINPLPTLYTVGGAGTFCASTSVSVSNSDAGTSYQLKRNGTAVGSTVSGTGSALNWTSLATSGSYTITSTIVSTGCAVDMSGTAAVTINPLPTLYSVAGSGTFCLTTSPSLSDTDTGINYQLKSGSTSIGSPVAGTGSAITMPAATTTGTYTVIATNASTSCFQTMTGSAGITIQTEIPNAVASAQTICSASATSIGITTNNGVSGATYAWVVQSSSNATGASSGSSPTIISQTLSSTNGTTNGTVTYRITPSKGSCVGSTTDVLATIQPLPVSSYIVGGAGTFCGSTPVTLSNSQTNFIYQLKRGGTNVGSTVTGNAALLTWAGQAQTGSYTVEAKNPSGTCPVTMSGTAAVTINPLPTLYTVGGAGTFCQTTSIPLSNTNTGINYQLKRGSTSVGSPVAGTGSAINWSAISTAGTYTVVATNASTTCVQTMTGAPAIVIDIPSVGGTAAPGSENFGMASGAITLTGKTGAVQKWQAKVGTGAWTDITNTTTSQAYTNVTATSTYRAEVKSGACPVDYSTVATVTIYAIPQVAISGNTALPPGGSVLFNATAGMYWYQWYKDNAAIIGADTSLLTITHPGTYKVSVKGSSTSPVYTTGNAVITYAFETPLQDMNYIQTVVLNKAGVGLSTDLYDLQAKDFSLSTTYFDGLGKQVQTVALGAGGNGNDLVQPNLYDEFGREAQKYLPYGGSSRDGRFQPAALDQLNAFYASAVDVAHDTVPYSRTVFEPSPLNRPAMDFGPGQAWSPSEADKFVEHKYLVNVHGIEAGEEKVIAWMVNGAGNPVRDMTVNNGYYTSGSLMIKSTTDEQGNEVREYTNKSGQVILKKVFADGTVTDLNSAGNWAQTYYIYDDLGQLRFVFQPELSRTLAPPSTSNPDSTALANFAFQYRYDGRNRMIGKRVPGASEVLMVYDRRDRLVLSQDGNLRAQNQWQFTKYDTLNRPVVTGIYSHGSLIDQEGMSALIDTVRFCETVDAGNAHGYSVAVFPTDSLNSLNILTVTYYDNYTYLQSAWGSGFNYVDENLSEDGYNIPDVAWPYVTGQVTGTKAKVLDGGNTYLRNINYYDDRQRPIQMISDNYKAGKDWNTTLYDFAGKVLETSLSHEIPSVTRIVSTRRTYDASGRPLNTYHKVGSASEGEVLLYANAYNSIGQLKAKNLYGQGGDFSQELDYKYNIRGWLTRINQPDVSAVANGDEVVDYFGMELSYEGQLQGLTSDEMFNGNISSMKWAVLGKSDQAYSFEYDPMSRLLQATHFDRQTGNQWSDQNGRFSEGDLTYDLNGNIQTLTRMGPTTTAYMDDLSYHYTGNQLLHVDEGAGADAVAGFANGNIGSDDYTYDPNGNMTQDKNKGIGPGNVRYNFLNLPRSVRKTGADSLVYVYDATGRKLKQQVYGTTPKTTDYDGDFIYENDTLRFIQHEEGRLLPDGSGWEYQYHLKDHLGNVRLTFTSKRETVAATATLEDANQNAELGQFLRYANARRIYAAILDKTNGASPGYAQRLSGSSNEKYGIARSLSVMPGDTIRTEVYGKYIDPVTSNWTGALNTLVGQIVAGTSGVVFEGGAYSSSTSSFQYAAVQNTGGSTGGPKAYLNWLIFDRAGNFIDGGYDRMSTAAKEYGQNVAHELLSSPDIIITQPGIVYIYLSNEEETPVEVFFDDLKVEQALAPVVQMDDYYPFGLTFNSYSRENSVGNKYLYNQGTGEKTFKTERVFDLDLNVDQSRDRTYDYITGRWWQVDPKADKEGQESWSTYNYSFDNPIRFNDPYGDCIPCMISAASAGLTALGAKYSAMLKPGQEAGGRLLGGKSGASPAGVGLSKTEGQIHRVTGSAKDGLQVATTAKNVSLEVVKDGAKVTKESGDLIQKAGIVASAVGLPEVGAPLIAVGNGLSNAGTVLSVAASTAQGDFSGAAMEVAGAYIDNKATNIINNAAATEQGAAILQANKEFVKEVGQKIIEHESKKKD